MTSHLRFLEVKGSLEQRTFTAKTGNVLGKLGWLGHHSSYKGTVNGVEEKEAAVVILISSNPEEFSVHHHRSPDFDSCVIPNEYPKGWTLN